MAISASSVAQLRKMTGAGMMDCKKALVEADGDMDKAEEIIAKAGQKKIAKSAARIAAEGAMFMSHSDNKVLFLELNCETDFVAKNEAFSELGEQIVKLAFENNFSSTEQVLEAKLESGVSVADELNSQIATLGEKITLRRLEYVEVTEGQTLGCYKYGNRLVSAVIMEGGNAEVAKDVAMHVVGLNPMYVDLSSIPVEIVNKEKEVFQEQVKDSGKPVNIIEKMIEGKVRKHFSEMCLLLQPFVKDGDKTVEQLVKEAGAKVLSFKRLEVGEGIEKKETNFAQEVMEQAFK